MKKIIISLVIFLITPVTALAEDFVAGKDYVVIQGAEKPAHVQKAVPVAEFFSYGCPWCYRLEAGVEKWVSEQGSKISFSKVPVIFKPDWVYYAKAYYTASALSLDKKLTPELFQAIQKDKQALDTNETMVAFLTAHGIDATTAHSAFYNSPSIDLKLEEAKQKMAQYQIAAVPAILVNNQYKTDLQMAKSEARFFAILDYLVTKAAKEQ